MSISAKSARRLFQQLSEAGIPLTLSVPFLIRARGWQVQHFCHDVGIHRGYLNALLRGLNTAAFDVRIAIRRRLGFDPWQAVGSATTSVPHPIIGRATSGSADDSVENL